MVAASWPSALILVALFGRPAPAPDVYLAVVGAGENLFSLYGHAALVVQPDPSAPLETASVYNFGVADFADRELQQRFVLGEATFWGQKTRLDAELRGWRSDDRDVDLYPLELSEGQRGRLVAWLEVEVDRRYIYDTFRENCATRLRDGLDEVTGGAVYGATGEAFTLMAFREDVRQTYSRRPLLLLVDELFAGISMDTPRTLWERAYRPAGLVVALQQVDQAGVTLVGKPLVMHRRTARSETDGNPHRARVFIGVMGLLLLGLGLLAHRLAPWARALLVLLWILPSTLLGSAMLWAAWSSVWPELGLNWLVLVFFPLDALLAWTAFGLLRWGEGADYWARGYLLIRAVLVISLIIASPILGSIRPPTSLLFLGLAGLALCWRCTSSASLDADWPA